VALSSIANFMKITNLEIIQIPVHHFCGISAINCASKCDTNEECLTFNYNRGSRTCRLFNQTVLSEFSQNEEWTVYMKRTPQGNMLYSL